ncbi:peptide ABC transporter substrate-binding protein [Ectobacillus sp. JY-23]|uniref:peptide ABC transporter substrate-binding protein n=1 Tax=Ectobacillus sp. JY-23 TaxID=2933872 RepID=UPI001FF23E28|nr:peptide ABC transporter substrate-binding protein [Ectobacillus sp. JY-23]UOY92761.1 peptide ABC transporter substrate-binding protein [Ectobacillus sp. JY-23]
MKKKATVLTAAVLSTSMFLTACSGNEKTSTTEKKKEENGSGAALAAKQVLNVTETAEIPSMDTSKSTDNVSFKVFVNAMEGLYRLDKDNKPTPGMAKSVDVSADKKTYTFHLRDAKWSNGEPVKAQDFVFAWRRAVDPATASEYAFILFDIKNAEKVNKKELPLDQLGVTAKDDKTLVVELSNPVPYFLELTTFPTYFPQNEQFVKAQGDKYALESNTTLYNGPFVMSEWKHEQGWKLKKNPNYWDKDTVKLEEINTSVVKETSTAVNLYESGDIDRVFLTAEFVDKYKGNPDFKTRLDSRLFFIRFNQKDPIFQNKKVREAFDLAYDKKGIANVLLNDGSVPAYSLVPTKFVKGPDGKDFRDANKNFRDGKDNAAQAKKLWEEAKKELGQDKLTIEMLNYDNDTSKKVGEYIKAQLEQNLPGLTVTIKQQPFKQKLELEKKQEYAFSFSGWGPDYPDPMTFIDMFVTDGAFNEMSYSNPKYDELVKQAKGELLTDVSKRWKAMQDAEKILMEDVAISPTYQRGFAYMQKEKVQNVYDHNFGGDYSYKWAYIKK